MVCDDDIQALADDIAAKFDVERIILFGSHAYGTPHEGSDVDLLIEMEYEGSSLQKSVEIGVAVDPPFPNDILIAKPGELARRYEQLNPIAREALDRGKVLYDAGRAGVA